MDKKKLKELENHMKIEKLRKTEKTPLGQLMKIIVR